jgi:hypothetical protein
MKKHSMNFEIKRLEIPQKLSANNTKQKKSIKYVKGDHDHPEDIHPELFSDDSDYENTDDLIIPKRKTKSEMPDELNSLKFIQNSKYI